MIFPEITFPSIIQCCAFPVFCEIPPPRMVGPYCSYLLTNHTRPSQLTKKNITKYGKQGDVQRCRTQRGNLCFICFRKHSRTPCLPSLGSEWILSIEICMLLPPLTQGTDKATRICLILKPSRTMSPLHFNLLFILVFSTTCIAVQERAIGMSNYNFQRHGSFIVPKYFTQSHAACFMSNIQKSSRWRLRPTSWRISSWLPRRVGLAVRVLLYSRYVLSR